MTAVFTDDAVYAAREAVDREALNMPGHIADLLAEDGRLVADRAAMDERGVAPDEIAADVDILDGEAVAELLLAADHTLDF